MSEKAKIKARTCKKCERTFDTDAWGIKKHAQECHGKPEGGDVHINVVEEDEQ